MAPTDTAILEGDRSGSVVACTVVTTTLACLAVGLRFYTRGKLIRAIGREDWVILTAVAFSVVSGGWMIKESQSGLGQHKAALSDADLISFYHASYFMTLFYNLSLWATKISILFLYLRVLTYDYIIRATWVTFGIVMIYNVWAMAMYFTMCVPIEKMWDKSRPDGYCHPIEVWWALTYLHIITDFLIFFLPIPVVVTMTVPMRQKAGLLVVFATGFFVCLISVLRTIWLNALIMTSDPMWDLVAIAKWSSVEINLAIMVACLMTMKPLLRKMKSLGPLLHRWFPNWNLHRRTGNGTNGQQITIGSMPMKSPREHQTLASSGFAPLESSGTDMVTLSGADTDREVAKLKGMDLEMAMSRDGSQARTLVSSHSAEIGAPPMAHVKDRDGALGT